MGFVWSGLAYIIVCVTVIEEVCVYGSIYAHLLLFRCACVNEVCMLFGVGWHCV